MGSYNRFPKTSAAAESARLRDAEWREGEWRRAMQVPRPSEIIDATKIVKPLARLTLGERRLTPRSVTRH